MPGLTNRRPLDPDAPKPQARQLWPDATLLPRAPMYEEGYRVPPDQPSDYTDTGVEQHWAEREQFRANVEKKRAKKRQF